MYDPEVAGNCQVWPAGAGGVIPGARDKLPLIFIEALESAPVYPDVTVKLLTLMPDGTVIGPDPPESVRLGNERLVFKVIVRELAVTPDMLSVPVDAPMIVRLVIVAVFQIVPPIAVVRIAPVLKSIVRTLELDDSKNPVETLFPFRDNLPAVNVRSLDASSVRSS